MAIQINSTNVIDNSRQLVNITGADATTKGSLGVMPQIHRAGNTSVMWSGNGMNKWLSIVTSEKFAFTTGSNPGSVEGIPGYFSVSNSTYKLNNYREGVGINSTTWVHPTNSIYVYRTADTGTNWSLIYIGYTITTDMHYSSSTVWGALSGRVMRSTNGGTTWTNTVLTSSTVTSSAENGSGTGYIGGNKSVSPFGAAIWKSTDGFATYTDISSNIPTLDSVSPTQVLKIAATGNNVWAWVRYGSGAYKLWKSTNSGTSWSSNPDVMQYATLDNYGTGGVTSLAARGNTVAIHYDGIIYYSTDAGSSFKSFWWAGAPQSQIAIGNVGDIRIGGTSNEYIVMTPTTDTSSRSYYFEV